jgi:DNA-binding GntR family transcriptional regulator
LAVAPKISQADRVYAELRERLTRGRIPIGSRIVEQQLAAEFRTSRTPVREALRRLEGDGHLTRDPSGGMRPRVPSVRAMRELYDVRLVLEELVVRRAASSGDRGSQEALEQDWRALDAEHRAGGLASEGAGFVHRDEAFHQRLATASGNDVAASILGDLGDRIRILRIHDFTSEDRIGATIAEHLEIIGAIIAGDADEAASYMRAHIQRSAQVVRERIGEALTRMFEEPPALPTGRPKETVPRQRLPSAD